MTNPKFRKRTKAEREEQLIAIAAMHVLGAKHREIAARFVLTQSQISRDLKEIHRRWAENRPSICRQSRPKH